MQINIKEKVDVNQDGPSLIIEASPGGGGDTYPGPQIAKMLMFSTYEKLIIYCFLCCTFVSSVMRSHDILVPLYSTYGSPGPPTN